MNVRFPSIAGPFAGCPVLSGSRLGALALLLTAAVLAGCQNTAQGLLADGYPPQYAAGFDAGCESGRQAGGARASFSKDVPRFQAQPLYADGWRDGYHQCQAMLESADLRSAWRSDALERQRDREWRHHVDQAKAQAYRRR